MNATCERLAETLRRELLDRILILGQAHLRDVLADYQAHYTRPRPHRGIGQRVPACEHDGPRVAAADPGAWHIRRKPTPERPDQRVHPSRLDEIKRRRSSSPILFSGRTGSKIGFGR